MQARGELSCPPSFASLQALLPSARAARRGKGKTKNRDDESPPLPRTVYVDLRENSGVLGPSCVFIAEREPRSHRNERQTHAA